MFMWVSHLHVQISLCNIKSPGTSLLLQASQYKPPATSLLILVSWYKPPDTSIPIQASCYKRPNTSLLILVSCYICNDISSRSTVKTEAANSAETSISIYQVTRHHSL
jgi:hypothetical protein